MNENIRENKSFTVERPFCGFGWERDCSVCAAPPYVQVSTHVPPPWILNDITTNETDSLQTVFSLSYTEHTHDILVATVAGIILLVAVSAGDVSHFIQWYSVSIESKGAMVGLNE